MNWKEILEKYKNTNKFPNAVEKEILKDKDTIKEMYQGEQQNRAKAIKAFCRDCAGETLGEVYLCHSFACPLYPYRFGTDPFHSREMSEEARRRASENMKKLREKQLAG